MDPPTKDETPDTANQGNPLTGRQIPADRENASSANPLDIMASLLHIKVKHSSDNPVPSDAMARLLHIKSGSSILCGMSAHHHHQEFVSTRHHLSIKGASCL